MSTYLYFAYGSNMLSLRLCERTPSARAISQGTLRGYRLTFHKESQDGSGKGHIHESGNFDDSVFGVLFEIDRSDKHSLDQAEGLGMGYDDLIVEVLTPDGDVVSASSYVGTSLNKDLKPYHWYKSFLVGGAKEHALPAHYIKSLEAVEAIKDPDAKRIQKNERIWTYKGARYARTFLLRLN
jgi:gamma-glutamylcyclotransferase